MMKKLFGLFLILCSTAVFAQEKFSDDTLQKFADAYSEIREESNIRQLNLVKEIEKAGLTMNQFTDIHIKLRDSSQSSEVSEDDKKKYEVAKANVQKFEKDTQKSFETIIRQKGLTLESYQAISQACKQDAALNKKVTDLIDN